MNEENTKRIIDIEPRMFPDNFYFSCGDGWASLLESLVSVIAHKLGRWEKAKEMLEKYEDEPPEWAVEFLEENPDDPFEKFEVVQVKEKFGGLRFYVGVMPSFAAQTIQGAIRMAESMAWKTCEVCGDPGELRNVAWGIVQCDACFEEKSE